MDYIKEMLVKFKNKAKYDNLNFRYTLDRSLII